LIALDGVTGSPCKDFGNNGEVSLDRDVRVQEQECSVTWISSIASDSSAATGIAKAQ